MVKRLLCKTFYLIMVSLTLISQPAFAGMENRPLSTNDATLLERGKFAVASGVRFLRQSNYDKELDWPTELECGIYDNLELDVEIPYSYISFKDREKKCSNGLGDVTVWLGFNPIKETEVCPVISAAFCIKTESGDRKKGLGSGGTDYQTLVMMSKMFGSLSVITNFGYTVTGDSSEASFRDTFSYNLALKYTMVKNWTLVGEVYGQTNPDKEEDMYQWDMLIGIIYNATDSLAVDFGIGTGLSNASPDLRITAGAVYTF